jgi:ankyrin repeat protein
MWDRELMLVLRAIATGDRKGASVLIERSPQLARASASVGASRATSTSYFFAEIGHYVYAGDTALHIAAAAYRADIATDLIAHGANPRARNRRGAEPLHYAAAGTPGSAQWNPPAQAATIEFLIRSGANPNSTDKSGVAPLHRAVRTRCAAAVEALLAHGANPRLRNGSGSTPLHLAVQNTGRGGSGTAAAREQQAAIVRLLVEHGARLTDKDAAGKSVAASVAGAWVEEVVRQLDTRSK